MKKKNNERIKGGVDVLHIPCCVAGFVSPVGGVVVFCTQDLRVEMRK
jgi:hypothetical protein